MPSAVEKLLEGEAEGNGRRDGVRKRATRSLFGLFGGHRVRTDGASLALPASDTEPSYDRTQATTALARLFLPPALAVL